MTQFTCHGPFKVPTTKQSAGKTITQDNVKLFWNENEDQKDQVGCYVYGMRAGKGITPMYVGKATKSFSQEVFSSHKLVKYLQVLSQYKRGTPVIFFVAYPPKKGTTNLNHIAKLEKFLIQQCAVVNPLLMNLKHASQPKWGIAGVIRSSTRATQDSKAFKAMFDF